MKTLYILIFIFFAGFSVSFGQYNLSFAGQISYSDTSLLSGCWGYTSDDGAEYALIATIHGTSIVEITTPTSPEELFFVPGAASTWREIKTWNNHAYVCTEGGGGLMIIDLSNLPAAIDTISFKGDVDHPFNTAHTLFIDENGFCYLFGYNLLTGASEGAYILDLNVDPKHPEYVAELNSIYIHDGFVRNDTLWASCIYEGNFEVFDVSNKSDIILLGQQATSASATHNCWLSDDGKYLFTTDEIRAGFISSFDVTDVTDMKQLDQAKHGAPDSTIAHNTYYLNGYLVTAHYSEGVTIHDVHKPENIIEVGHYDSSPFGPDGLLEGAWGVYPYFPSGTVIISDITEGLIVLTPNYQRACYLEGNVKDLASFENIVNAKVEIVSTGIIDSSNIIGEFKTGFYQPGLYDVIVSKEGCYTQTISNVELESAAVTNLAILLECNTIFINDTFNNTNVICSYNSLITAIQIENELSETFIATVYNVQGKKALGFVVEGNRNILIDVANLPKGAYVIQFDNHFSQKLLIY